MTNADKPVAPRKPRARRRKVVSTEDTPLDYMLKVMRDDEADQKRRDEMAKIAASYVHQKPSERSGAGAKGGRGVTIDLTNATDEQLAITATRRAATIGVIAGAAWCRSPVGTIMPSMASPMIRIGLSILIKRLKSYLMA